jgi:transcriptional regulator GlxA family with amidase domain
MRNWQKSSRKTGRISLLLFDQFSNHCLANALEPLRAANALLGRPAYEWSIFTTRDEPVVSSSGLPVMPTARLSDPPRGDALWVISGYDHRAHATDACGRMLRAAARRHDTVVGLDTGSWLMAAAGLLDGHRATIHPDILGPFAERFPDVQVSSARYLNDANRWSCGGAAAAFEMVQHMIGQTHGAALTMEIGALFLQDRVLVPRGPDHLGRDRIVERALADMRAHVETPLPLSDIAARVGCSQRQLESRFRRALGATPQQAYRRIRLNAARRLIDSETMPLAEVAERCGYANASAFSRAFRQEFGLTPRSLR